MLIRIERARQKCAIKSLDKYLVQIGEWDVGPNWCELVQIEAETWTSREVVVYYAAGKYSLLDGVSDSNLFAPFIWFQLCWSYLHSHYKDTLPVSICLLAMWKQVYSAIYDASSENISCENAKVFRRRRLWEAPATGQLQVSKRVEC